jgi:hypothetical protein
LPAFEEANGVEEINGKEEIDEGVAASKKSLTDGHEEGLEALIIIFNNAYHFA